MKLQHSDKRTTWIVGNVARNHGDIGNAKLQAIVADALQAALIHDAETLANHRHYGRAGRADGAIRIDGDDRPMKQTQQQRETERRARKDAAFDDVRNAWRGSRGMTRDNAAENPTPEASKETALDAMRNAWRK